MTVLLFKPNISGSTIATMAEIALSAGIGLDIVDRTAPSGA
ncbi:hypothetical protein [Nitratireductor sp. GCM10026969]